MNGFTCCVPWRPSPSRLEPFERMRAHWDQFFPGIPMVTGDSDTEIFSLAQARNTAVEKADTDIVVICDADTLPDPDNIKAAVANPVGVCWPFDRYRIIDAQYVNTPFERLAELPHINAWNGDGINGVGGCLVTTQDEYWRLGGSPPEFIGWGFEDTAFTAIVATLSQAIRIPGNIYAFEHNTVAAGATENYIGAKADSPGWDRDNFRNRELCKPYVNANGRPWLMKEILRRREAGAMSPYVGFADATVR
jgi:glycosyltransferase involved in cell wall biosynthesis